MSSNENMRKLLNKNTTSNSDHNNTNSSTEINPHMPQYITKAPWYLNQSENSLNHQRAQVINSKVPISIHSQKGIQQNKIYKFRKGACENCGSLTHSSKDCCERPRATKAKYSGKDLRPDEFHYEVPLDYEGKRDRWNGYNPDQFKKEMYIYQKLEEAKLKVKEEELSKIADEKKKAKKLRDEDLDESVSSDDENNFLVPKSKEKETTNTNNNETNNTNNETNKDTNAQKEFDENDEIVKIYTEGILQKKSAKENNSKNTNELKEMLYKSATSKSLHIGDDYSKYLLSLKENSAYYDPKSRSMRENPVPNSDLVFRGENALRQSGDALGLLEIENFIKEANQKNSELNLNNVAMPTQAQKFFEYFKEKKQNFKSDQLNKILEKYGGNEHLELPENIKKELELQRNNGEINENSEDEFVSHNTEYGSFFHERFGKGYKCCLSFDMESSCGGLEALNENFQILKEYEKMIRKELENEKLMRKKKEEDLNSRNQKESANGVFTEMMTRLDSTDGIGNSGGNYDRFGKLIVNENKEDKLLNRKRK